MKSQIVAVLGASHKPERYSNQAVRLLKEHNYPVIPISPAFDTIEDLPAVKKISEIENPVHTLTLYMNPKRLEPLTKEIISLNPKRVIFNPGTESPSLQKALDQAGIQWLEACTLVMLKTNQF